MIDYRNLEIYTHDRLKEHGDIYTHDRLKEPSNIYF